MNETEQFQKELVDSVLHADPKLNRDELLVDIFKTYVAKLFEYVLGRKAKNRIEFDAMIQIKRNLISAFRGASLGECQKSEEWYDSLFEETVQEIFNDAAIAHRGQDIINTNQTLEINPEAYRREGGLFVPDHLKK